MKNSNRSWAMGHFGFALVVVTAGFASLYLAITWLAYAVAVIVDSYLVVLLIELGMRRRSSSATGRWMIGVPYVVTGLPVTALLLLAVIFAFARMYIASEGVVNLVVEQSPQENRPLLVDAWDAVYFSAVTLTTVGYGDFVPTTRHARFLVLWQLTSTVLFLLGILPLLMGRLADFDRKRPG